MPANILLIFFQLLENMKSKFMGFMEVSSGPDLTHGLNDGISKSSWENGLKDKFYLCKKTLKYVDNYLYNMHCSKTF